MIQRLRRPAVRKRAAISEGPSPGRRVPDGRAGFSLIELLTVIAIIAILAAIIFPVAGVVRVKAQEASVTANLQSIHTSLGLFKQDEHNYPATLGPLVMTASGGFSTYNGLFPEYLKDKGAYQSPANEISAPDTVYPIDVAASFPDLGTVPATITDQVLSNLQKKIGLYGWDTMDGSVNQKGQYVLHYSRYRTFNANDPDYKRQLGWRNPPDDTVVTWNDTFVRRDDLGNPHSGDYLVLFLNGSVKTYSVSRMASALQAKGVSLKKDTEGEIWRIEP